jgi:hypothetical protein
MKALVLALALSAAALPAVADTRGSISESFTAGSGPYIGNSLSAGVSPGPVDLDAGYDFGSDQDLVLYHSIWGSFGYWPVNGFRILIDGELGPRTSTNSTDRGFFSFESRGFGGSLLWHPGRNGEIRPYLEVGGSIDRYEVQQSDPTTPGSAAVDANFDQSAVRGTIGVDVQDTQLRLGGAKYFYSEDAGALNLPPGVGAGPSGIGAITGALPTRAQDWNVRGSVRQRFGEGGSSDVLVSASYGSYVDGEGEIVAGSLRLGHDLTKHLNAHIGVTAQSDNVEGDSQFGVFGNAGLTFKF